MAINALFPDGDLENLSHFVQAYFHTSTYLSPILVGVLFFFFRCPPWPTPCWRKRRAIPLRPR